MIDVGKNYSSIDEKLFWSKVDIKSPDECWNWKACILRHGYGQIASFYEKFVASRVSYFLSNGYIDDNLLILHKCDNRRCVNPKHLYLGTASDNIVDREHRRPVDRALCGVTHAKFYEGEIWLIRRFKGKYSSRFVSDIFKCHFGTICDIWKAEKYLCREGYYV